MSIARDVGDNFALVGQPNFGDLAQCRVRLLRSGRIDEGADATLLRVTVHGGSLALRPVHFAALANQLVDRRHRIPSPLYGAKRANGEGLRIIRCRRAKPQRDRTSLKHSTRALQHRVTLTVAPESLRSNREGPFRVSRRPGT